MKNKKSIVDTIKQFLKKNIPETSIVLDTTITGSGYDSKPEDEPLARIPPTETQNNPANVEKNRVYR